MIHYKVIISQHNNSESSATMLVPNVDEVVEGELPQGLLRRYSGFRCLENEEQTLDEEGNDTSGLSEEELEIFDAEGTLNDDDFGWKWLENENP